MKKLLPVGFALALFMCVSNLAVAQNYEKGSVLFSGGYGFANLSKGAFNSVVDGFNDSLGTDINRRAFGPLYFKAEFGVGESTSIGLNVAYIGMAATWDEDTYNYKIARNNTSFLLRINQYWVHSNNFDLYSGIGIGYRAGGWSFETDDPLFVDDFPSLNIPLGFEATLGFRGYVTDNLAIYGELGISKGLAQVGVTYKL